MIILTLGIIIVSPAPLCAQINTSEEVVGDIWSQKASLPAARSALGVAVVDGKIYAIGGKAGGGSTFSTTDMYDPATNNWTAKASMQTPRAYIGIAVYQDKIYCIGGSVFNSTSQQWEYLGINEAYNPAADTWETKASMPTARSQLQTNVADGKIYVMGGEPNQTLNYAYDPINDSWTVKAPIPGIITEGYDRAAIYAASATVDNKIYWIGVTGLMTRANMMYNPEDDSWTQMSATPAHILPIAGAATTGEFASKKIYVLSSNGASSVYDPKVDRWTSITQLSDTRHEVGIAVLNDTLYAIGGHYIYSDSVRVDQYIPSDYTGEIYEAPEPTQTDSPAKNSPAPTPVYTLAPTPTPSTIEQHVIPTTEPPSSTTEPLAALELPRQTIDILVAIIGIGIIGLELIIWKRQKKAYTQTLK